MAISNGLNPVVDSVIITGNGNGLSALRTAKAIYRFSVDGGAIATITPNSGATLPNDAVIVGAHINTTTTTASAGAATISVGTSAGSSAVSLLAATAFTSFTADTILAGIPTMAVPLKLTAAGNLTVTIGTATLTAGVVEVTVLYHTAAA
jgi:hypothetical protein